MTTSSYPSQKCKQTTGIVNSSCQAIQLICKQTTDSSITITSNISDLSHLTKAAICPELHETHLLSDNGAAQSHQICSPNMHSSKETE